MAKYKNKLTYNRIKNIFSSCQLVLIGQYDSNQVNLWREFKKLNSFYIPKNSLCKIVINHLMRDQLIPKTYILEQGLFQGPIFILCADTLELENKSLFKALVKLKNAGIPIYGGFLDQKLLNFEDIKEITFLLKNDFVNQKPYSKLKGNIAFLGYFFLNINYKLFEQFDCYKNRP
uniref:ribosomal protein L10 n=1 Tax=Tetraselmis marina TaxID=41888 RepID=UPI0021822741|nr:ribosomal protein L10 [Tetraselmis marina]UVF37910.1 ribosomal protein L10 [Tetraselmis marina]